MDRQSKFNTSVTEFRRNNEFVRSIDKQIGLQVAVERLSEHRMNLWK